MTQQFDDPIPGGGGGFRPSEAIGALVAFKVLSFNPAAQTPWGMKPEVMVHVTIMHDPMQRFPSGEGWLSQKLSGKGLAGSLGQSVGRMVLGRLAAVQSSGGANPAVILNPASQEDRAYANQLCAANPGLAVLQQAPQSPQTAYPQPPGYPSAPLPPAAQEPAYAQQSTTPQPPPSAPSPEQARQYPPAAPLTPTGPAPASQQSAPATVPPPPPVWNANATHAQPDVPPF